VLALATGSVLFAPRAWDEADLALLVRFVQSHKLPFFFATRHRSGTLGYGGERRVVTEAWDLGGWEYLRIPEKESSILKCVREAGRSLKSGLGTKTELYLLNEPTGNRRQLLPADLKVQAFDFSVLSQPRDRFTEVHFGGDYLEDPGDVERYVTSRSLEQHLEELAKFLKGLWGLLPIDLAYIGDLVYDQSNEGAEIAARTLPGNSLQWITVFGRAYVDAIGREFILNAPGCVAEEWPDEGVFYRATSNFVVFPGDTPSRDDVQRYFRKHPRLKNLKYRPVEAKRVMKNDGFERALAARRNA